MTRLAKEEILEMTISERMQLIEDLWDSVVDAPEAIQLSEEQKAELDLRLAELHDAPDAGSPWNDVHARIKNRRCRSN